MVLALPGDPGGAAAWAPVLAALNEDPSLRVEVRARPAARPVLKEAGLSCGEVHVEGEEGPGGARDSAEGLLDEARPDLLLTGSRFDPGVELAAERAGRRRGIPVLSLLDSWTHYRRRYQTPGEQGLDVQGLPDVIGVMDDLAREEMVAEGFPMDRLRVVGHPGLDRFMVAQSEMDGAARAEMRRAVGVQGTETLVVFFSQPLSRMFGGPESPAYRGYDEGTALACLLEALETLCARGAGPYRLVVRPHPKEDPGSIAAPASSTVPVEVSGRGDLGALLHAADLIVGMTSIVLVKAFLAGLPTVSLQPGLRGRDELVLGRTGHLDPVTDPGTLPEALQGARAPSRTGLPRPGESLTDGRSVERVTALCQEFLQEVEGAEPRKAAVGP